MVSKNIFINQGNSNQNFKEKTFEIFNKKKEILFDRNDKHNPLKHEGKTQSVSIISNSTIDFK